MRGAPRRGKGRPREHCHQQSPSGGVTALQAGTSDGRRRAWPGPSCPSLSDGRQWPPGAAGQAKEELKTHLGPMALKKKAIYSFILQIFKYLLFPKIPR